MQTIRQTSGLAGFPKRDESAHDAFGTGHSSTSISAGLGNPISYAILISFAGFLTCRARFCVGDSIFGLIDKFYFWAI